MVNRKPNIIVILSFCHREGRIVASRGDLTNSSSRGAKRQNDSLFKFSIIGRTRLPRKQSYELAMTPFGENCHTR